MDLESLRKKIIEFNNAYEAGKPIVEDYIYDFYKKKLEIMEKNVDTKISNLIGSDFKSKNIEHLFPILSLNHEFGKEPIEIFLKKIKKFVDPFPLVGELKVDGVSVVARYTNGKLTQLKTRGNGYKGENIFHLKEYIDIPNNINIFETIEIRFEAFFNKDVIENPRNAAAGILLKKNPDNNLKLLNFVPHNLYSKEKIWDNYIELRMIFDSLLLNCIKPFKVCYNLQDCYDYFDEIEKKRKKIPYEIDGIVFKINDKNKQDILGNTAKAPRHSFAIKFTNSFSISEIKNIKFQVGRQGNITPVAMISEVLINNRKITKATLNNLNYLYKKNYNIGDIVKIEIAGDVIPKITDIIEKVNNEKIKINNCPSCNMLLEDNICKNGWNCLQQKTERLKHFASKQGINIKNLGDQQIEFFINEKILNYPYNFFTIKDNINKIKNNPSWLAEKSLNKIIENIEKSKYCELYQFYSSLGFPNLGKNKAKLLAEKFNFEDFLNATNDDLLFLGENISAHIKDYLEKEKFWIVKTFKFMKLNQKFKKFDLFSFDF